METNQFYVTDSTGKARTPVKGRIRIDVGGGYIEIMPSWCGNGIEISHNPKGDGRTFAVVPRVSNMVEVIAVTPHERQE